MVNAVVYLRNISLTNKTNSNLNIRTLTKFNKSARSTTNKQSDICLDDKQSANIIRLKSFYAFCIYEKQLIALVSHSKLNLLKRSKRSKQNSLQNEILRNFCRHFCPNGCFKS